MSYTAKRVSKLEKEIGYCELRLIKARRLRKKIQYFANEIMILQALLRELTTRKDTGVEESSENSKRKFLASVLKEIIATQTMQFIGEKEELETILQSYNGIEVVRGNLESEKRKHLDKLSPRFSRTLQDVNREYRNTEILWSECTENFANLDNSLFYLERNLDYLRSCRAFLILAIRVDLEDYFLKGGNLLNLLKHSNISRAWEMAAGADRNIIYAQAELVCISQLKVPCEKLKLVLLSLLNVVYSDIFVEKGVDNSLKTVESVLAENLALTERLRSIRVRLADKTEQVGKKRMELFSRLTDPHIH